MRYPLLRKYGILLFLLEVLYLSSISLNMKITYLHGVAVLVVVSAILMILNNPLGKIVFYFPALIQILFSGFASFFSLIGMVLTMMGGSSQVFFTHFISVLIHSVCLIYLLFGFVLFLIQKAPQK